MKQSAGLCLLLLAITLAGCNNKCFDDIPAYRSSDYGKTLSISITQNNNPISFDSVTVIYPKLKNVSLNRTPLSLSDNHITLVLRKANTPADTLTIGYEVNSYYSFECEKASVVTNTYQVHYSTFDNSYFIRLTLAE